MTSPTSQNTLLQDLNALGETAQAAVDAAGSTDALEALRVQYLGRKGQITGLLRGLKDVPAEERPAVGEQVNQLQQALAERIDAKLAALNSAEIAKRLESEAIDVTMPGVYRPMGSPHPLRLVTQQICEVFQGMGFTVMDDQACPEVETDYYNFDALNFPADHPARDMQDTYYTTAGPNVLLRSQTSNAQIRHMEKTKPPIRVISPGRVYRNEEVNARKFVLFHQLEGLLVDTDVTFGDLKGVIQEFIKLFFAEGDKIVERPTRFRASFFPFTEPSAEVDVQCIFCKGNGCTTCGGRGWLEIMGCGMVDPNVLETVGIDSEKYTGFAFGMGIECLAILKYAVPDIRLFFNGDLRFLNQDF